MSGSAAKNDVSFKKKLDDYSSARSQWNSNPSKTNNMRGYGIVTVDHDMIYGAIDTKGNIVVDLRCDYLEFFDNGVGIYEIDDKRGLINVKGKEITPPVFDIIRYIGEGLFLVSVETPDGSYETKVIDAEGKTVIPPIYDSVFSFKNGMAVACKEDKWGAINLKGNEVVPFIYDDIGYYFQEGCLKVSKDEKWGFVNQKGKLVVPIIYSDAGDFVDGTAPVCKNGKWGIIDSTGRVIVPFEYDWITNFTDGLACAEKDGHEFFIDRRGRKAIGNQRNYSISPFFNNAAIVSTFNPDDYRYYYGLINKKGVLITDCIYIEIIPREDGYFCVRKDAEGLLDNTGRLLFPCKYYEIGKFDNNLVSVKGADLNKYGIINSKGEVVLDFKYDYIGDLGDGIRCAGLNDKYGYINNNGDVVIPFSYDTVESFSNGIAVVGVNKETEKDKVVEVSNSGDAQKELPTPIMTDPIEDTIYSSVDTDPDPEFPGGDTKMVQWIHKNLCYPESAKEEGIEGRAFVRFIVEKDGSISSPQIVKGVSKELDWEALRLIKAMPKWTPGLVDGKPVRCYFMIPITFRL